MKELKRTKYNYMQTSVIASRQQLCIHPKLQDKTNTEKIHLCKAFIKKSKRPKKESCGFYDSVEIKMSEPEFSEPILDIEDLAQLGKKLECCPYFVSKDIAKRADIIFMPYNYLIDPKIRAHNEINLNESIVILDEAHNVDAFCEESASTVITSTDIIIAIRDMKYVN